MLVPRLERGHRRAVGPLSEPLAAGEHLADHRAVAAERRAGDGALAGQRRGLEFKDTRAERLPPGIAGPLNT